MRQIIYLFFVTGVLTFMGSSVLNADDIITGKNSKTRIETFLAQKERLLVKDIYNLGKITGLYSSSGSISAIVTYEPGVEEKRLKGLIVEVNEGKDAEWPHVSYLDMDEIEGLSAALGSMAATVKLRNKKDNHLTETVYITRDDLSFGFYIEEKEEGGFISAGGAGKQTIYLEIEQISDIKKTLDYGHTLLKMK